MRIDKSEQQQPAPIAVFGLDDQARPASNAPTRAPTTIEEKKELKRTAPSHRRAFVATNQSMMMLCSPGQVDKRPKRRVKAQQRDAPTGLLWEPTCRRRSTRGTPNASTCPPRSVAHAVKRQDGQKKPRRVLVSQSPRPAPTTSTPCGSVTRSCTHHLQRGPLRRNRIDARRRACFSARWPTPTQP